MKDLHIRWMIRRDMPDVLTIERDSFPDPWSEDCFVQMLGQHNIIGMVAEHNQVIVGFMVYELLPKSLKLHNFAVAPAFRLKGVGRRMVEKLAGKLSPTRRVRLQLVVNENNLDAQLFFKACGCRALRVIPEAFQASDGSLVSGYLMQYRCPVAVEPA